MVSLVSPIRRYLAYGSNLHPLRMIGRVPSARLLGITQLRGYQVRFEKRSADGSSKCNLVLTETDVDVAYGAVYEIPTNEKHLLDAAEGVGKGYVEKLLSVEVDSAVLDAFTYVAASDFLVRGLPPYDWYKALVLAGARYHRFSAAYIDLLAAIPSSPDSNPQRSLLNRNLLVQLEPPAFRETPKNSEGYVSMATRDYAQLVAQAEAAVASVKDPELKRVAFQKVLDDLLGTVRTVESTARTPKQSARRPEKPNAGKKVSSGRGPQGYVNELAHEGYFRKPKTIAQVKAELENRGHHIALTSLSGPLQKLCQRRVLRRQKTTSAGGKQTYAYSDW